MKNKSFMNRLKSIELTIEPGGTPDNVFEKTCHIFHSFTFCFSNVNRRNSRLFHLPLIQQMLLRLSHDRYNETNLIDQLELPQR